MGKIVERSVQMTGTSLLSTGDSKDPSRLETIGFLVVGFIALTAVVLLLFSFGYLLGLVAGLLFPAANCEVLGMPFEVLCGLLAVLKMVRFPKVEKDA